MDAIQVGMLPGLFESVAEIFAEKKDELCAMDANMGDGDLGLTMSKGFGALPELLRENSDPGDLGKTLMKAGMKMSGVVPSTMGTLMSSGLMQGGKALAGQTAIDAQGYALYLEGFTEGLKKRGKCSEGERTILDAMAPAARAARAAADAGENLKETAEAAAAAAEGGVEATKSMIPKYGKAVVFRAKAAGVPDQGAVAGSYMLAGMLRFIAG